jgi:DNA polymerase III sliding clamp (beta) subunit (PCNA family)
MTMFGITWPAVKFTFGKDQIELSARTKDGDEARETVVCVGEAKVTVALNPAYVLGALQNVAAEELAVQVIDSPGSRKPPPRRWPKCA